MNRRLLSLVVGLVVGVAGGLVGLGGAELRLPYLVGVLGLAAKAAVPVNLAVSLVTVLAALPVRVTATGIAPLAPWIMPATAIAVGGMVAAYFGAGWLTRVSTGTLERLIGSLLIILGLIMLVEAVFPLIPAGLLPPNEVLRTVAGLGLGMVIGAISSLLGVAGGEIIIPTLVIGYGVPVIAAGTLSLFISLPTILVGMARYWRTGGFDDRIQLTSVIAPLAIGAVIGAPVGAALVSQAPAALIKVGLAVLLIWSAWKVFGRRH